ncbi:DUF4286 family protein [Noviherbaspirillum denitrificans]|uniref:DUF4286 family protein n=1 Tax=Noviherbaspirillum denitrificans TaxID=1968433 RepID=UPI00197DD98C|nr:DUF4286 family protein [Noviherbaspirillum denitrificans]
MVMNDVVATEEQEFNHWYQREHMRERLQVPGFRSARRYRCVDDGPRYMAVYECDSVEVLQSPAYRHRLTHPTDWTRKIMPSFRNMLRSACRETWNIGDVTGGAALVIKCKPDTGKAEPARRFIHHVLAGHLSASSSTTRVALWEGDDGITGPATSESALRAGADDRAEWVIFVESLDVDETAAALRNVIAGSRAEEAGLQVGPWSRYRLMCILHSGSGVFPANGEAEDRPPGQGAFPTLSIY